jgi:hypothetical protein
MTKKADPLHRYFLKRAKRDKITTAFFLILLLMQLIGMIIMIYTEINMKANIEFDTGLGFFLSGLLINFMASIVIAGFSKDKGYAIIWLGPAMAMLFILMGLAKLVGKM